MMTHATLPALCLLFLGCSATQQAGPAAGDPAAATVEDARGLLRDRQYDEALLITDRLLRANPNDRAALLVAAEGNLALFHDNRDGSRYFLADATRNLERALDLDRNDPDSWLQLSYCQLNGGEFDDGRRSATTAFELLREAKAPRERVAKALLAIADNEMQSFVDVRRPERARGERPGDETTTAANRVLTTLNAARQAGAVAGASLRSAQVYQWLDRGKDALQLLEDGIRAEPTDNALHEAFQGLYFALDMRRECVAVYKRMVRESRGSAALQWFLGRAQVALGDDLRAKTEWAGAAAAYSDALETYRAYATANASNRDATAHWIAICELSLGRVAFEQGDLLGATARYEAAYAAYPKVADHTAEGTPVVIDSFGGNYLGGLSMIGKAISESTSGSALRDSLDFFERIISRHPDRFGAIYNNAALSARDLGVRIAGTGPTPGAAVEAATGDTTRQQRMVEAMALWEKSYAYYEKAVALEPDDPRIVNDCGLMLIYHLHRDYDRARALFDRAIELGEAELAALPADASAADRNFLEEATGDAYQNIGVLLDLLDAPAAEIRPYLEKSLAFYPYQRRQSAAMLRELDRGPKTQDPGPDTAARRAAFDAAVAPARKLADEGDWDAALLVLDKLRPAMKGSAPFHFLVGEYSRRYADQAARDGGDAALVDGLYNDGLRNLKTAVELDGEPIEPRLALSRAYLATGDSAAAAREASSLLSHIRSVGGDATQAIGDAHRVRAEAAARAYIAARQQGAGDESALADARSSFREIEAAGPLTAEQRQLWTTLEQWAGAGRQAVEIVQRAWRADPGLVGEFVDLAARVDRNQVAVDALAEAADATSRWYLGRARYNLAQSQWGAGDGASARASLDAAQVAFEESMRANAEFRDTCEQWIALCLGSRGIVEISAGDHAAAEESLLAAIRRRPEVLTNDLGGGATIKRGILLVGDRHYQDSRLDELTELYAAASDAAPADVDFANNHGLFARDHGNQLERRGDREAAARLYEASYAAYSRAARLDPENVRLRNDCALLLIYHLHRDLDLARELLESSIADGTRQLAENPPSDERALRDLQEAVGDAHGNLGYHYMNDTKEYAKARAHLTKSLEYYPFNERAGTGLLRRLEGLERGGEGRE